MIKSWNGMENRIMNGKAWFYWNYSTIVDLFYIYKNDNNQNIVYINHLWWYPQSLIGKKPGASISLFNLYIPVIQSAVAGPRSQQW